MESVLRAKRQVPSARHVKGAITKARASGSLADAVAAGRLLSAVKSSLGHGRYGAWLKARGLTHGIAHRYLSVLRAVAEEVRRRHADATEEI